MYDFQSRVESEDDQRDHIQPSSPKHNRTELSTQTRPQLCLHTNIHSHFRHPTITNSQYCAYEDSNQEDETDPILGTPTSTCGYDCGICKEGIENDKCYRMDPCGHLLCTECWRMWAEYCLESRKVERCPKCGEGVVIVN
jgi:hypothetical protein